ncbi:hypothetical protein SAMN04487967_1174 [Natronorubrum sediminis]|uniref:Uncharacterized protein n=1 Tax=Natronorubrum sediminis TaxID=640943 RepID=A0A1H6FQF1_9EURY|nr:hypothetical protein [Natronorubrum sediminis]SEH13141.1 hypothetical protein SAMN04487967_1174 [Natronorubrum sediminis]
MSIDQTDPKLRFEAGRFESSILTAILMAQLFLVTGAAVGFFAALFLSLDLWYILVIVPSIVILSIAAYLLSFLYE